MGRLLDEDDVVDWLLKRTEMYDGSGHFVGKDVVRKNIEKQIAEIPSVEQEIIHCKDCKYQDEGYRRISVKWLPCMDVRTGSNWYCGSAERRQDE